MHKKAAVGSIVIHRMGLVRSLIGAVLMGPGATLDTALDDSSWFHLPGCMYHEVFCVFLGMTRYL